MRLRLQETGEEQYQTPRLVVLVDDLEGHPVDLQYPTNRRVRMQH